jgi:diguanylate cyclase (GGDEF)-like protein
MPVTELLPACWNARDHIICVDDEEGILTALRQQLVRFEEEWEIDLARSAQEALDLIKELELDSEAVAMVIADQIMPGMKGVELLEEVHRRHPRSIKILLTGQAGIDAVVQAINRAGLDHYIAKPWDEQDLRLTVDSLLVNYRLLHENQRLLDDLKDKNEELLKLNWELDTRVKDRTQALEEAKGGLEVANRRLADANQRLAQLAITDGLTGLYNHRYFHERLANEVERSNRTGLPLSLLMIDVDNFKHYNDLNGHPAGDTVLRTVSQILSEGRRLNDAVARYGGEEFAVLLVDTPSDAAANLAEQLRARVEQEVFINGEAQPGGHLTISLGVASYPDHALTAHGLVESADTALYRAKNTGRNRVEAADNPDEGAPPR